MKRVPISIRIPSPLHQAARRYAEANNLTLYASIGRALELGVAGLLERQSDSKTNPNAEILGALSELAFKLEKVENLVQRSLHVGCAAYTYARFSALSSERDPARTNQQLTDASNEAFARQQELAKP